MTFSEKFRAFREFAEGLGAVPPTSVRRKVEGARPAAAIVALNLAAVYMLVLINEWNRVFYDALQNKDAAVFWRELGRFTYLAFGFIIIAVYRFYLTQLLEMRWRAWMTGHYLDRWLATRPSTSWNWRASRQGRGRQPPDNPDQRIAEDMNLFTSYTRGLSMGLLNAVVTLVSFVGILWGSRAASRSPSTARLQHSGLHGLDGGDLLRGGQRADALHRPPADRAELPAAAREADFRHHLVRVREYSESIALDKGEPVERQQLGRRFGEVLATTCSSSRRRSADLVHRRLRPGRRGVSLHRGGAAFLQRRHPARRADADRVGLRPGAGLAVVVRRQLRQPGRWRATTDRLTSFEDSFAGLQAAHARRRPRPASRRAASIDDLQLSLPGGAPLLAARA
jgi:vitamin B12/bleomycin/antimicrobial peptide transport system ATP-binding/permease protein